MGELVQSMLGSLAGAGGTPGATPSPVGVVPPESGGMTRAVMGFPAMPYGGGVMGEGAPSAGGMSPEMGAVVQGFKTKKINFFQALGDQLLKHWGNQPAFQQHIDEQNLGHAMEGFTKDPVEAIRRISQIPGHEKDAWDLLNTVTDNTRSDQAQNRLMGKDRESIIEKANRYFGAVNPDGSNWPAVKEAYQAVMKRNGIDIALPDEWNPDLVALQIASGMTMNQQDMSNYRDKDLARKTANTQSQIEHRTVQEQQGERRLDQTDTAEQGRNDRYNNPVARPKAGTATPSGESVLPDGSRIIYGGGNKATAKTSIVIAPDGTKRYLNKLPNGKWKVVAAPVK